jgi:hypothetical protein
LRRLESYVLPFLAVLSIPPSVASYTLTRLSLTLTLTTLCLHAHPPSSVSPTRINIRLAQHHRTFFHPMIMPRALPRPCPSTQRPHLLSSLSIARGGCPLAPTPS